MRGRPEPELRQALANLAEVLGAGGRGTLADVVKTTVFLVDMADFAAMNEVWTEVFAEHRPARSAVAVAALPLGARVEVEAWAHRRLGRWNGRAVGCARRARPSGCRGGVGRLPVATDGLVPGPAAPGAQALSGRACGAQPATQPSWPKR